ncbi:MAG: hypothetical protein F8N37_15700 [Telmatospirillum sp.]|nr:hypothetical protein [Telmatospirillum sp.]
MTELPKTFLQRTDDLLRWTGMPAQVARDCVDPGEFTGRAVRWQPVIPTAIFVGALVAACRLAPVEITATLILLAMMLAGSIFSQGPLGRHAKGIYAPSKILRRRADHFRLTVLVTLHIGGHLLSSTCLFLDGALQRIAGIEAVLLTATLSLWFLLPTWYTSWRLPGVRR